MCVCVCVCVRVSVCLYVCMYMILILEASVLLCSTRIAVEIEASRRCALWIDNRGIVSIASKLFHVAVLLQFSMLLQQ